MATHIHVSAGGTSAFGSRVNIPFDNATSVTLIGYSAASAVVGNLLSNCTWALLDYPATSVQNAAYFQGLGGGTLSTHTLTGWIPDVEGTWFFRCTNNADSTVDEIVVGTRHLRTNIRVPAAGETTEADTDATHLPVGKGWALDRNRDLNVFDDLCTSGGVQLCYFKSASLAAAPWSGNGHTGALVQFIGEAYDINPTTGVEELVPVVDLASTTGTGVGRYVGVIKAKYDGTTTSIASGSRVWVSRSGVVQSATSGVLDFSAWSAGDTVYVGATAGIPAKASEVDTNTATVAGVVVSAEDKGTILVTPAEISTTIFPKDQQLVEVEVFEASVPGALMWNTGTKTITPYGASSAVAATIDFTFTDKPLDESTITIRDSDGTAVIFEIDNEADGVEEGGAIAIDDISSYPGGTIGTASDLAAKINEQATLDVVATNPSAGKVVLTQGTAGIAGNTTISVNDAAHWAAMVSESAFPAEFTGGAGADYLTLPGALMESGQNARDVYLTSIAVDERCIREGTGTTASNWMEYPLVLELHGYSTDQASGTAIPTLSVDIGWNYNGKHSNVAASIALDMHTCNFSSIPSGYLSYEGNTTSRKELIFKSPLIKSGTDTDALDFYYAGTIANEFDGIYGGSSLSVAAAYATPPVSVDLKLSRTDGGSFDLVITKVVLKALYPSKSRAKRLSFYERQAFAAALVDSANSSAAGRANYTIGSGGPYVNIFESSVTSGTTGFNRETAIANLRGETAADLVGYFPFDNRLYASDTTTQPLRFRTIGKYKGTDTTPNSIKLQLSLRGEIANSSTSGEFATTTVSTTPGSNFYQETVEVTPGYVVASGDDDYITVVHDWVIASSVFPPNLDGVRYKISRLINPTYKTTDNVADATTTEVAFGISNVILSEGNLRLTKTQANLFEDHIAVERFLDDNDGASNMTLAGDCPGFLFEQGESESVILPVFLDERFDPQKDLSVDVTGYLTTAGAAGAVGDVISLKLEAASSYFNDLIPSFSTIGTTTVTMPANLGVGKTQRSVKHTFTVPYTLMAQASGVPEDNLSIPLDNRRGCLYLKISRTDTTGSTDYVVSHVSTHSAINKQPNADPYVNISENSSYPLIVSGGSVHDDHHDILTTSYRHNWSYGLPNEFARDLFETASSGISVIGAGQAVPLLPANFLGATPFIQYGSEVDVDGATWTGQEIVGKHVPFSMVITAIHGYMVEPVGVQSGGNKLYGKGLSSSDAYIELFLVEMCNSGSTDNAYLQKLISCDDHPGIIGFPFKVYPSASNTNEDAGVIRYVGNDLSTNISAYKTNKTNVLPRVYLPADYANGRQWMLTAVFVNAKSASAGQESTLASTVAVGAATAVLAETAGLPEFGVIKLSAGHVDEASHRYTAVDSGTDTITFLSTDKPAIEHPSGRATKNERDSQIIAPTVDLNIEVAFLPNTTGNDLIY